MNKELFVQECDATMINNAKIFVTKKLKQINENNLNFIEV